MIFFIAFSCCEQSEFSFPLHRRRTIPPTASCEGRSHSPRLSLDAFRSERVVERGVPGCLMKSCLFFSVRVKTLRWHLLAVEHLFSNAEERSPPAGGLVGETIHHGLLGALHGRATLGISCVVGPKWRHQGAMRWAKPLCFTTLLGVLCTICTVK